MENLSAYFNDRIIMRTKYTWLYIKMEIVPEHYHDVLRIPERTALFVTTQYSFADAYWDKTTISKYQGHESFTLKKIQQLDGDPKVMMHLLYAIIEIYNAIVVLTVSHMQ